MQWAAKLSSFSLRVSLPLTVVALLMLASDGWCQQELRSGKKGATSPAPVTSTAIDADTAATISFPAPGIKVYPNSCISMLQIGVSNTTASSVFGSYTIVER